VALKAKKTMLLPKYLNCCTFYTHVNPKSGNSGGLGNQTIIHVKTFFRGGGVKILQLEIFEGGGGYRRLGKFQPE